MEKIRITNCHIHLFTMHHIPNDYLPLRLMWLLRQDYVRTPLIKLLRQGIFWREGDVGERAARFASIGSKATQEKIFNDVSSYYPKDTRFVVLPMDMAFMRKGEPSETIYEQHDELYRLSQKFDGRIIPFCAVDPRRPKVLDELKRCHDELGFKGVKLYPPLGYKPCHKTLMEEIYPYCIDNDLPVMSHCSQGGVREKWTSDRRQALMAGPTAFKPVFKAFRNLKVCLAHFGGDRAWNEFLGPPLSANEKNENWLEQIMQMLENKKEYPNLYTDISYTAFKFKQNVPALNVFLNNPNIREKVLFGSDFYMTEIEGKSERRVSIELRHGIGEEKFRQIAETNPRKYLGF